MEKENKFVSLVVYLYNNEDGLKDFLDKTITYLYEKFSKIELVCVDDASLGNEVETVRGFCKNKDRDMVVNVIHMSYHQGLESAMNAGRDLAIGDFVYEFDTTVMDYDIGVISRVYEKMLEGYDIVSACSSSKPKTSSRLFYRIFNAFSREKGSKLQNETFRIITRRAINRAKSMGTYIPYRKAVYASSGLKTEHVVYDPIKGVKRDSTGRMSLAIDSFVYFTHFLESLSSFLSVMFLIITIIIAIFILSDILLHHNTADGWLSIMGFLSVGFFGVFLLLSIVLKYQSAILNVVFKHNDYVISDIEKIL